MFHRMIALTLMTALILIGAAVAPAEAKPVITADKNYYDVESGLYILKGNVYIEVKNRVITADEAKVSLNSMEVWASGNITVTQDDIYFSGDSVYVCGSQDRAEITGNVSLKRTGLAITANRAEFNWDNKTSVFSNNVQITQGDRSWTADSINYNVATNTLF